jgi:hypothetical protein
MEGHMTTAYKLTIRTSPGALIAAEYECPVHGRFALDVPREANGDPPATADCPKLTRVSGMSTGGSGADRGAWLPCAAYRGEASPHVISAPGIARVKKVSAAIRGSDKATAEFPTWTDTTNLAEGQDLDDWKDDRAKVWDRERERQAMEMAREL